MADCFFCGNFVGEVNGDGGVKGRTIGGKDFCEQCLGELKHVLNNVKEKTPSEREAQAQEEDDSDQQVIIDEVGDDDPLSSGGRI